MENSHDVTSKILTLVTMDMDAAALLAGFLNTVHLPDGVDALEKSTAADWRADGLADDGNSVHQRPATTTPRPASETEMLRTLRAALRALVQPHAKWTAAQREAVARADEALRNNPILVRLPSSGRHLPQLAPAASGATESDVAAVLTAYFTACADGGIERIKTCARPECQWAFLDASRNSSRRWCAMAHCGNVVKNRRYRARRSATNRASHRPHSRSQR
jgi:predicted RNA-binding Zn ribbon-like protein